MCCSVLQCVAVCCSVLQCVIYILCCIELNGCVAVCCSVINNPQRAKSPIWNPSYMCVCVYTYISRMQFVLY